MDTYTAITSETSSLPPHLALLTAPVFFASGDAGEAGGKLAGHLHGVVLDPRGHVGLFIFEPSITTFPAGERLVLPLAALEFGGPVRKDQAGNEVPIVRLLWSEAQLLGQPRLKAGEIQPSDTLATPVPPSPGGSGEGAIREALYSGAVSGAAGAVLGLALGGPLGIPLGVFFAIGGGIAGAITGASAEPAAEAAHLMDAELDTKTGTLPVRTLEQAIRSRSLYEQKVLRATPIVVTPPSEDRIRLDDVQMPLT